VFILGTALRKINAKCNPFFLRRLHCSSAIDLIVEHSVDASRKPIVETWDCMLKQKSRLLCEATVSLLRHVKRRGRAHVNQIPQDMPPELRLGMPRLGQVINDACIEAHRSEFVMQMLVETVNP
jgi:hypothetical protein